MLFNNGTQFFYIEIGMVDGKLSMIHSWELLYKGWFTLPTTLHRLTVHLWQSDNQQREGADIQRDTAHQKVAVSCCSTHSGNEDYRMSS